MPIYVLSPPTNLIDGEQSSIDSRGDNESGTSDIGLAITAATDRERDYGGNQSSSSSSSTSTNNYSRTTTKSSTTHHIGHNPIVREIKKHRRKQKSYTNTDSGNDSSSTNTTTTPSVVNQQQTNIDQDVEIPIKFRLSNGKEHRLYCKQNEKIRNIKRRLGMLENGTIDSQSQRLYFGGKLLRKSLIDRILVNTIVSCFPVACHKFLINTSGDILRLTFQGYLDFLFLGDRSIISEARLQRNFVVQVILNDKSVESNDAITTTAHLTTVNNHLTPVE